MTFRSSLNSNVPSPNLIERSDDFNILSLNKNNEENLEESSTSNNLSESGSQIFNQSKNFNSNFSTPKSLVLIPNQPVTEKEIRDKESRCFQTTWYKSFKWIQYDETKNVVICFCCLNFGVGTLRNDKSVTTGFDKWKKAIEKFKEHEKSNFHTISFTNGKQNNHKLNQ
ncbi:unnamed protein product [Brachionus calyciflorus]|uniref:TTF-type domain-containing protein n=1 Tax=Brachionus calyciflorus TaxID=104777 RepID=A0A814NV40_9BILA|nr:unnamed protein product [Brachionus calyciflorus]